MLPVFRQEVKSGSFTKLRRAPPGGGPRYLAEMSNGANQDDGLSVNLALSYPIWQNTIRSEQFASRTAVRQPAFPSAITFPRPTVDYSGIFTLLTLL